MSQLEVDKIIPQSGTTLTIGDSGDTISFGTGTTPQLGGDLDLNSNDITGTGNINITGNVIATGDVSADGINATGTVNIENSSTYGRIEIGGPSGAFIDMKTPFSDDYDGRIICDGTSLALQGASGIPVKLTYGASTKLETTSTGIDVTGTVLASSRIGIGTDLGSNPSGADADADNLVIDANGADVGITLDSDTTAKGSIFFADGGTGDNLKRGQIIYNHSGDVMSFATNASEAMRINSDGDFLIGKSDTAIASDDGFAVAGVGSTNTGQVNIVVDGGIPLRINRQTSDGDIIEFRKDGTIVGNIGTADGDMFLGTGDTNLRFNDALDFVAAATSAGAGRDNAIDLGFSSIRFDDIYATNGTIQTSDQNEKQSIQSLTASEMAVAQRISKLFKTFKWNSAVEEKGDNARTHTGVIAQEVQQAFSDEGLDASNYGMFMSNTWWEKEISVDAVAAQDAVYETQTDEEGNEIQVLVQEAVEGKDAYTYIDNKYEPTEGYTEKTRLGIRYPELLSFVSSAFEQRLTDIETRLTALEA